ncbi:DUF2156 domain-containing protein [Mesorhizobium sp. NBSH29]|uniref:phosphatidylglycerol lysyltransferase domain-containing protein n=1 Tax=Mesorhizobium sp. NBSH29 TaxID=2654249 RepID=UPI0018969E2D|nr:phosphatidylglycerol lysyltransferase domain-containing protein [Mesorhizobium sp. NBSH29]QPC86941.1 DUF2156 domain-containing protein [Mesorhizobium sp. NBSH29]
MASLRKHLDRFLDKRAAAIPRAELSEEERLVLAGQWGDFSLAYSTAVQDNLSYFGDKRGYIAFRTKMGQHYALGDPVADPANHPRLIRSLADIGGDPWFVQISRNTAEILSSLGYKINRMGVDTHLALPGHDFSGKQNQTVRHSERWLAKQGFTLSEQPLNSEHLVEIERLSEKWRATRIIRRREMTFLNRPFSPVLGTGMRRFVLHDPDGNLVAMLDFDPLSRNGKAFGYTTAFKRKVPGATPHAEIGLTKFAVDCFRLEGASTVTLGLSPLADIQPSGFDESRFWRSMFQRGYHSSLVNRYRFNVQGQAAFKRRFHGTEEPTYIAFRKGTVLQMTALLRLLKIV